MSVLYVPSLIHPVSGLSSHSGADQRLAVSSTVVQFSTFEGTEVWWDVQDQDVMVTFDGSDPDSTNGHKLAAGESGVWPRTIAEAARFIRAGATDGVIHATSFK